MPTQVTPNKQNYVEIGKIYENLVTEVVFPVPGLGDGTGSYTVVFQRPKETAPYPVATRVEFPNVIWEVGAADTAKSGTGKAEVRWYGDDGEVGKSKTFVVRVNAGLADPTEAPEAWEGYVGRVARNAETAETAAADAAASAQSAGADAVKAEAALKALEDGIAAGDFRGEKGDKGDKGDPGGEVDPAAVQKIVDDYLKANPPQAGADGKDGITPTIGENGNWYLGDTDTGKPSRGAAGAKGADGANGKDGAKGDKGDAFTYADFTAAQLAALKGEKGDKGDPGEKGNTGADGKSAYQYAQDGGYTGTEMDFSAKLAQEILTGTTDNLTPAQVYEAVSSGRPVKVQYTSSDYGLMSFTAFSTSETIGVIASQNIVFYNNVYILAELGGYIQSGQWFFNSTVLAEKKDIPTVPTSLKSPYALTIKIGETDVIYDGSEEKTVEIADGSEVSY